MSNEFLLATVLSLKQYVTQTFSYSFSLSLNRVRIFLSLKRKKLYFFVSLKWLVTRLLATPCNRLPPQRVPLFVRKKYIEFCSIFFREYGNIAGECFSIMREQVALIFGMVGPTSLVALKVTLHKRRYFLNLNQTALVNRNLLCFVFSASDWFGVLMFTGRSYLRGAGHILIIPVSTPWLALIGQWHVIAGAGFELGTSWESGVYANAAWLR